ncbi:polyprotein [Gossypium australe]|uniref:Polyprotein n=1 Tax=Gossypium australe TaxID=47621 RepID=A0A5B6X2J8_9ROSI|nr:polyprotein [Gossypium australe]
MVKGQSCIIHGIVPGSLAAENNGSNLRCFVTVGQALGPYAVVMSSPEQETLLAMRANDSEDQLQRLLVDFDNISQVPKGLPPPRLQDHRIPLKDEGVVIKIYPAIQKSEMEKLIQEMLQAGIIKDSNSSFASPIVMVKKKDGSWRLCVDYRQLNQHTIKIKLLDELGEASVFSKLDLRLGYHQIRMWEPNVHKIAFRTHEGHYEFLVMPFGLTNAPSSLQALMNSVFKPLLRKFVLVFFDDILVYSRSWSEHLQHLRAVLLILREQQLYAKKTKCCFGTSQIEYLGHVLHAGTVSMDKTKIKCISHGQLLDQRFIKDYGVLAKPLIDLLKKNGWSWSDQATVAFQALKGALCAAPILVLPNFQLEFTVDASGFGIGAVLQQQGRPVAFFSKALGVRPQILSIYEKEMLAVLLAVRKWHAYLVGRHFKICTDHQSLRFLSDQVAITPFQQRWVAKMLDYDFEVSYRKGINNRMADALSRQPQLEQCQCFQLSASLVISGLLEQVQQSYEADDKLKNIIQTIQQHQSQNQKYSWDGRFFANEGKNCGGENSAVEK